MTTTSSLSLNHVSRFVAYWGPRTLVASLAGLYSLGLAYESGLMACIDRLAIRILRHYVGYIGLGAVMPTFQWYAAWTVRVTAAFSAGLLYDLTERIVLYIYRNKLLS